MADHLYRQETPGRQGAEGSGVPVGTEYHWYLLAHQIVTKLNANDYSTSLTGVKYKLAHKRAGHDTWSASTRAQRKRLIKVLQEMIRELEEETEGDTESRQFKASTNGRTGRPGKRTAAGGRTS